jgi:hypothetical protein
VATALPTATVATTLPIHPTTTTTGTSTSHM